MFTQLLEVSSYTINLISPPWAVNKILVNFLCPHRKKKNYFRKFRTDWAMYSSSKILQRQGVGTRRYQKAPIYRCQLFLATTLMPAYRSPSLVSSSEGPRWSREIHFLRIAWSWYVLGIPLADGGTLHVRRGPSTRFLRGRRANSTRRQSSRAKRIWGRFCWDPNLNRL